MDALVESVRLEHEAVVAFSLQVPQLLLQMMWYSINEQLGTFGCQEKTSSPWRTSTLTRGGSGGPAYI